MSCCVTAFAIASSFSRRATLTVVVSISSFLKLAMFFHQSRHWAVEGIKGDARVENNNSGHISPSQIVIIFVELRLVRQFGTFV